MENKVLKKIVTSCAFPMLKYTVTVAYNEVKKASGIAYILLVLLKDNGSSSELLVDVLSKFGIPKDLHYIFAKELNSLIAADIVSCNFQLGFVEQMRYLEQMRINEFHMTERGRILFLEGAIPTGEQKGKAFDELYYSPVSRKFILRTTLPYADIATSFLGEDFMEKVEYDISDMDEYLRSVKTQIGLKAEERIVKTEIVEEKQLIVKNEDNLTIEITDKDVTFSFKATDEKAFFERYYSSAIMAKAMLAKEKYKFVLSNGTVLSPITRRLEDIQGVVGLHLPADAKKQIDRPCKLLLNKGGLGLIRSTQALTLPFEMAKGLLDLVDTAADFALLDNSMCRMFIPLTVQMPCAQFGDVFSMQLLAEVILDNATYGKLLGNLLAAHMDNPFDAVIAKIVLLVATAKKQSDILDTYTTYKLEQLKEIDEKIGLLLQLNSAFSSNSGWNTYFDTIGQDLFERSLAEINLNNLSYKNSVLAPLTKALGMNISEYLNALATSLRRTESVDLVYQALVSMGYDNRDVLRVANVVKPFMIAVLNREPIQGDTELETHYAVLSKHLWQLCDMLGVDNYRQYTIRDDYNIDDFFNAYATFQSAYGAIKGYEPYAKEEYELLGRYLTIFNPIHELLSTERTSAQHPEKISVKYIDELISRGRYSNAICDLLIKVQYELRKALDADTCTQANELIDMARDEGLISRLQADSLHQLRICRNGFQHPESGQVAFTREQIEKWKETVFSIVGGE